MNDKYVSNRTRGAMDNASAYGAEDSRFESWRVRYFFLEFIYFGIIQGTHYNNNCCAKIAKQAF